MRLRPLALCLPFSFPLLSSTGLSRHIEITAFVKAKVNNAGVLVFGYTKALRPGVKASFGLAVDTANLGAAAHKVGSSLTFDT
ncbi:hypothetical protein JCM10207_006173 [Rhodosporidiobolus poonsookiae]